MRLEPWIPQHKRRQNLWLEAAEFCLNLIEIQHPHILVGFQQSSLLSKPPNNSGGLQLTVSVLGSFPNVVWLLNGRWIGETAYDEPISIKNLPLGENLLVANNSAGQAGSENFAVH